MGKRRGTLEGMGMRLDFWSNKRILITGHTGFKGSWLSFLLAELGANVTGFALPPKKEPNLFSCLKLDKRIKSIIGDIREYDQVKQIVRESEPEIIFHMAAQPLVNYSYTNPVETYETNVMGTVYLLEAARSISSVRSILNVTSDKCYENKEWVWGYRENDPMGGYDPYSSSKGCSELISSAYRNSFFSNNTDICLATARAGNVIGGGDWTDGRIIPDVIKAIESDQQLLIRYPKAIRPWQHVLDALYGYLLLAEKLLTEGADYADSWNFGPAHQDNRTVEWLVERIYERWGIPKNWVQERGVQAHEASYLKLDCSKAASFLNWEPKWCIETTLLNVVDWYKKFKQNHNVEDATLKQIYDFFEC